MMPELIVPKMFHAALDDTIEVLEEIHEKRDRIDSIFEVEVMRMLQDYHRRYGAVFTLYLFYEMGDFNLSMMTDRFREEWIANSDWLRLSFHSRTRVPAITDFYRYTERDYDTAKADFELIKGEILRFAGEPVWDNYPRTHFWSGNQETLRAWQDCGISGTFFSYPGYSAYDLSQEYLEKLWGKDYWIDPDLSLLLITTNVKLPCLSVADVAERLQALHQRDARILEIFADDYNLVELAEHMESALAFAVEHDYQGMFYDQAFGEVDGVRSVSDAQDVGGAGAVTSS